MAIVPLAGLMGEATEKLAARLGAGVGGLLNATFGNAAELIIAMVALQKGLYDVVKASLTGSIIGNVLLVLGLSMVAGGLRRERQMFDRAAASASSTLLLLAAIALVVPAVFHFVADSAVAHRTITAQHELALERSLSLEIAIVLFVTYVLSLVFTLRTHRHLYTGAAEDHAHEKVDVRRAVVTLLVATALIAWMSELLVGAVEETSHRLGLTEVFVGVIVVAVIGNAAEHSTAVLMAMKNKMDLALNIAVGSSIQIALFVAPALVFASWAMGQHPALDLHFTLMETIAVAMTVAVFALICQDGESHWMEGVMLLAVYLVFGLAFYHLPS
jgi:Ca2+:H+ antiporter